MEQGNYNPPLSIVATARNDDHGGNLLHRMQLFLNGILSQSKQYDLDIELILVEWNPPLDRPRLVNALNWASDPGPCRVRIIEVPPEIHRRFRHSDKLPLFQMLAKNIGIRRAFGRFVLATNIDILFSDELIRFLASGRLKSKYFYRVDRYDVALDIPSDMFHESVLEHCSQNVIRICELKGIHDLHKGQFFSIHQRNNWCSWLQEKKQDLERTPVTRPTPLHTNACGDFALMSRDSWFNLRGYSELELFSFHLDSLGVHAAYHSGLEEKILKDPMRIYHIEHATGSGWTPEGQTQLNHRIDQAKIARMSNEEFNQWGIKMRREGRPVIFAGEDWGLANENLPTHFVYEHPKTEIKSSNKKSFSINNSQTINSRCEPEKISETSYYLVIDPKFWLPEEPLVSVVIPSLNRADFLVPTIESVLQQNYPHLECIVVDGGSTDSTIKILKSYGDRIKWISEPDRNHADAIAKGWRMCKGDILTWLNADDLFEIPDAVSRVVEYFKTNPEVSLVYGDCGKIDAEGTRVGMSYSHPWDLFYAVEYCDHCIPQPAAFIRSSILEKVEWLDTDFPSKKDHELWLRIGLNGEIRHLPVLLAHAREIDGLSQDGEIVAQSCLQVTRKFFSLPNVPPKLRRKKRRAFSNSYLKGMDYAFYGGRQWKIIFKYALCAVLVNPVNAIKAFHSLRRFVSAGAEEGRKDNRLLYRLVWNVINIAMGNLYLFRRAMLKVKNVLTGVAKHLPPRIPNLLGDRDIEWSWVTTQMPPGPGEALDFGPGGSYLSLIAASNGYEVTTIDIQDIKWTFLHPQVHHLQEDILNTSLPLEKYDLIINCSTVEHVGLAGRYGVAESRKDGDLEAMAKLRTLMKPDGVMLLTVPVGQDKVCAPLCRVYGRQRLSLLLKNFTIVKQVYWAKDKYNRWVITIDRNWVFSQKASVTSNDPLRNVYALGCFVLRKV